MRGINGEKCAEIRDEENISANKKGIKGSDGSKGKGSDGRRDVELGSVGI